MHPSFPNHHIRIRRDGIRPSRRNGKAGSILVLQHEPVFAGLTLTAQKEKLSIMVRMKRMNHPNQAIRHSRCSLSR